VATYTIRVFGDPVLKQKATDVANVDGVIARLAEDMIETMRAAPGIGLAAPQVGVQKRLFVYQLNDDETAHVLINPAITESSGEWSYEEGCLSVPGLYFPIVRPKEVHVVGYDLDGQDVALEADELLARLLQHEMDHLDGTLLLERLEPDQRKAAMGELRRRMETGTLTAESGHRRGL
jgi:peptide deformylase